MTWIVLDQTRSREWNNSKMQTLWLNKDAREAWEIQAFISAYKKLPGQPELMIENSGEKPDYVVVNKITGERFGVELTSAYIDDRSVPEQHMSVHHESVPIPDDAETLARYKQRLIDCVRIKVEKARKNYQQGIPLILSVYVNEYISIYLETDEFGSFVNENLAIFDDVAPFIEVVFWSLPNDGIVSVKPGEIRDTSKVSGTSVPGTVGSGIFEMNKRLAVITYG